MNYEKGKDGSYFHNNILIRRDDDSNPGAVFNNQNETITAFLNGYAIIPMKKYCELTNQEYDDTLIKEADKEIHTF